MTKSKTGIPNRLDYSSDDERQYKLTWFSEVKEFEKLNTEKPSIGVVRLPAESMTAVSLCPAVLEHTETERPLRKSLHHPLSLPDRCD